jgi:ribosomal-protein-alanine N-acetyltransferase
VRGDRSAETSRSELTFEPMTRRMLGEVMEIEQTAYPKPWSRATFESELDQVRNGSRHYIVARERKRLVGYAGLWLIDDPSGHQAHITNIVVASDLRGRRLGTRLMVALAEAAIGRGCVSWTLEVRASNVAAQTLYQRFEFVSVGVRQRYYENTEDAIVMWCHELGSGGYVERVLDACEGLRR